MRIRALGVGLFCAVVNLSIAFDAAALSIYQYTGNSYTLIINNTPPVGATYTTAMNVSGSFELAAPLPANLPLTNIAGSLLSYAFDDGVHTLTDATSDLVGAFNVATDALGNISLWQITAQSGPPLPLTGGPGDQRVVISTLSIVGQVFDTGLLQECPGGVAGSCGSVRTDLGQTPSNPGTWALIPEPSTALLLGAGLAALAVRCRSPRAV
jgi:PEP-CTERM motif-containing protein